MKKFSNRSVRYAKGLHAKFSEYIVRIRSQISRYHFLACLNFLIHLDLDMDANPFPLKIAPSVHS
jgi:hypothetical protein